MELIISTLKSIYTAILFPPYIVILLAMLIIFYNKNKRITTMQKMIGDSVESPFVLTLSQFIFGIFGGIIGSIILNLFGIVFNENCRIELLFLASIILMFIKPRFVCFSYSASLLGIMAIVFKVFKNISHNLNYEDMFQLNILYIMIFVGVMHMVEGILVFLDGYRGAVPILNKNDDEVCDGYSLKRYWIIPISVIIMGNMVNNYTGYNNILLYDIPNYWTAFKSQEEINILKTAFLSILSFYAVLGYSSVTYTRTKKEKARSSGIYIFSYGILLVVVSQAARIGILGEIFVVIYAPASHEFMIKIQRKVENLRKQSMCSDIIENHKKELSEKSFKDVLKSIKSKN